MSDQFSEKPARQIAAAAMAYKSPVLVGTPDIRAFSVTPDQVKAANAKRDAVLTQAMDRFKRK